MNNSPSSFKHEHHLTMQSSHIITYNPAYLVKSVGRVYIPARHKFEKSGRYGNLPSNYESDSLKKNMLQHHPLPIAHPALILGHMISHPGNSNWLEIDRSAIANNLQKIKDLTSVKVMAVVKANGYGHGITEIAKIAAESDAAYCGVARIDEALELRRAGISSPVLVLGHTPNDRFNEALGNDVSITIFQPEQVNTVRDAVSETGKPGIVHVKVDTGMSRLGATPSLAFQLVQNLSNLPGINLEGIFTHYACADAHGTGITEKQESQFLDLIAELDSAGIRPPIAHAANSAAALTRPSSYFDMVRIGIAIFGMSPSSAIPLPDGFKRPLAWKAQLSTIFSLPPGRGVSYGHDYVTTGYETIGVIPVGYGDGYRWIHGNEVLVRGKRAPLVGRVCMDQVIVKLDHIPEAKAGDEVVLLGTQENETITANSLAEKWGTINYEVTCGLSARVPRFYHSPE
jgi:alanine racemase